MSSRPFERAALLLTGYVGLLLRGGQADARHARPAPFEALATRARAADPARRKVTSDDGRARERLGHVVGGFAPPGDAFERLVTRRGRKQRNRRIRAGALGVIVALAMGLVFVKSVTSNGMPADQPEPRPAPAVVSGALAYGLDGDIYVADPDGTNPVRITDVAALDDDECPGELGYGLPSWSPDGRYLAFRGPLGPGCSSSTSVVITDPQGNGRCDVPGTGPAERDGARVVARFHPRRGLGRVRAHDRCLPDRRHPRDADRDAARLETGRHRADWPGCRTAPRCSVDQYEVPLDGGTPRELPFPFTEFNSWPQRYSPDGSLVAYANRHGLMVARPDGSEPRAVFGPVGPYTWTWSPNGELIALSARPATNPWPPNELHVVDVATGSVTQVFEGERRTVLWVIGFSPEGDRILFIELSRRAARARCGASGSTAPTPTTSSRGLGRRDLAPGLGRCSRWRRIRGGRIGAAVVVAAARHRGRDAPAPGRAGRRRPTAARGSPPDADRERNRDDTDLHVGLHRLRRPDDRRDRR